MPQRNDLSRSDTPLEQQSTLIAVVEMSQSSWLVAGIVPGLERHPLKKLAPGEEALLGLLQCWWDEAAGAGCTITRLAIAFEAGRDGFWLARWLRARGIEAHVVHPTSVAVSPGAPAGQDRPARHGAPRACLPRPAARRAGPLPHGRHAHRPASLPGHHRGCIRRLIRKRFNAITFAAFAVLH
jgi:hypothetical protein